MADIFYSELLDRVRQGMSRDNLTQVMPALLDVDDDFENPTKLRLLGNAIANNKTNAAALQNQPKAIDRLLSYGFLGIQILYNGCIENKDFSQALVNTPHFIDRLEPDPVSRMLIGAMFQALDDDIPLDFEAKLVVKGFVELILGNVKLEQHPIVINNFARIYEHCQKITQNESEGFDPEDGLTSLGFEVVGNISAHPEFGLAQVEGVPEEPFTWDTVALLINLTASQANLEAVFTKWPNLVSSTIKLLREEDPENVEVDEIEVGPQSGDNAHRDGAEEDSEKAELQSNDKEEEDKEEKDEEEEDKEEEDEEEEDGAEEDEAEQAPFDLKLWGVLFRNIARYPSAAEQLKKYEPAKLVTLLLESPLLQDVAWDFARMFAANQFDHHLTSLVTEAPCSESTVLVASAIVQGLLNASDLPRDEVAWATPKVAQAITEGLCQSQQLSVWVKGTRALAILMAAHRELLTVDVERLVNKAPKDNAVQSNLEALRNVETK